MNVDILGSTIDLDETRIDAVPGEIRAQVAAYERADRVTFDLDIAYPSGFLGRVMQAMDSIPYGQTRTYGELANTLDTSPIAVGQACARNPVPLVVPCHRVVRSDGDLGGYSGADGVETKRQLLVLESDD